MGHVDGLDERISGTEPGTTEAIEIKFLGVECQKLADGLDILGAIRPELGTEVPCLIGSVRFAVSERVSDGIEAVPPLCSTELDWS